MRLPRNLLGCLASVSLWLISTGANAWLQSTPSEADKERKQAELNAIQEQIAERLDTLKQRQQQLTRSERELQELEQKTAQLARRLQQTRREQAELQQRIDANLSRQSELQQQQKQQADALEQQVANAYTNGEHDFLKLLLNQQNPADIERMLSYYHYFNQARIEQIERLKAVTRELSALQQTLEQQHEALASLAEQQQRQRTALQQQQAEQETLLAKLQQRQRSDQARLQQLEQSREQLEQVIEAIEQALKADVRLVGLEPVKSRLQWPTQGRVRKLFGQSREGPLRWKGVMIEGANGQAVRTIADGRVLFANWLRGFGLVTVIDHGEGYMSLYGHNQTLLKDVGDEVKMGEEIALMGQSGGRSDAALYFEIRYRGNAQNPTRWIN